MMGLHDVAKELLSRVNAASRHITGYADTSKEDRLMQDAVYVHILQIEKPYRFVITRGLTPMKENKGDAIQFKVQGKATTDPRVCVALVSVLGFELQRLSEHTKYVLHIVSPQGTGFTFDYSTPIEKHHWIEGAADVKIAAVIFKENFQ